MDQKVLERLSKIRALANAGVGGEKENAEQLLQSLMEKYGVREEDLRDDEVSEHMFKYWGHLGKKLFYQIVYSILGKDYNMSKYTHKRNCNIRFITCTKSQAIEIKETFEFYRYHLDEGFKNYLEAFIQKQHIFPTDGVVREMSFEEELAYMNSEEYKLSMVMQKHERLLMIED